MAFTSITVTGTFKNIDGTPASGVVIFKLSQRITNGAITYSQTVAVHATLNATGGLSQALPANNDPATVPKGSRYTVTVNLNGEGPQAGSSMSGDEYSVIVPHDAPGGTVTLGSLLPAQEGE